MNKMILFLLVVFRGVEAATGQLPVPVDNVYLSSGHYAGEFAQPLLFVDKPAVLPASKGVQAAAYCERRYMVDGLDLFTTAVLFSAADYGVGLGLQRFGNADYNEHTVHLAYGRSLGQLMIGANFCYHTAGSKGDRRRALATGLSSVWKLNSECFALLQVKNITLLHNRSAKLAPAFRLGIGYRPSSGVNAGLEFHKEELRPPQFIIHISYRTQQELGFRAGFISSSAEIFAGVGWQEKKLRIELLARQHAALGLSPALFFTCQIARE